MFGDEPLISNKYWSNAMKEAGFHSDSFMSTHYDIINRREDFDRYYDELSLTPFRILNTQLNKYLAFLVILFKYDILHVSFVGILRFSPLLKRVEHLFYFLSDIKIINLFFGGDYYRYSKVVDESWRHGLLSHYPDMAKLEHKTEKNVAYWNKHSDCIIGGLIMDGNGRWDILPFNAITIDEDTWKVESKIYNDSNGATKPVKIVHSPNHRVIKGTEYIIQAVDELKKEGYNIDFILLEKKQNEEVKQILSEADILVEQIILGYGLNGIEGMALGLPVCTNIPDTLFSKVFSRYSYINKCPIVQTSPETIKENLKRLIEHPELRKQLGQMSRIYVEKYHSKKTAILMFSRIYRKIWFNEDIDVMNYFHPVIGQYEGDFQNFDRTFGNI
jgi:glycosyltransferase involved in cell wall biosynthesis